MEDLERLSFKMQHSMVQRGLILRNEKANEHYTTDFLHRLYKEEGKDVFSTRANVLGHEQQGGRPSVFDRVLGTKMGSKAHYWIVDQIARGNGASKESACLLGLTKEGYKFRPVEDLKTETDFQHRMWNKRSWMEIRETMKGLAAFDESDFKTVGNGCS